VRQGDLHVLTLNSSGSCFALERLKQQREEIIRDLVARQRPDGDFLKLRKFAGRVESYVKPTEYPDWYFFGECPFATANILYHTRAVADARMDLVRASGCESLVRGMENGVSRYVPDHHKPFDFPADIDDTCLAVAAVEGCGRSISFNLELILGNTTAAYDFYTWFVPRADMQLSEHNRRWLEEDARVYVERLRSYEMPPEQVAGLLRQYHDTVEPAICANVLLAIWRDERSRPHLNRLLSRFENGDLPGQYYSDPIVPYFHGARLFEAMGAREDEVRPLAARALAHIEARQGDQAESPFYRAMAALTAIYLGRWGLPELREIVNGMLSYSESDGEWNPLHYCNDLDGVFVDGSAELTAALHLEVFDRVIQRSQAEHGT
jgi:hypothetical protein